MKLPDYRQKKSGIGVRSRPKGVEIPPKITKMCVQLNGTNRSTQANEAGSGGFRRRRHRRLHRGMCKGAPRPDAAGPSAVRDCPTARSRHDSPVAAAACEGMEDRLEDQPVRTSGAPERACPLSLFTDLTGAFDQTLPFLLGSPKGSGCSGLPPGRIIVESASPRRQDEEEKPETHNGDPTCLINKRSKPTGRRRSSS